MDVYFTGPCFMLYFCVSAWYYHLMLLDWCKTDWPVDADDNKDRRGENEAASSEHHENFTSRVTCIPLYSQPPESLHWQNNITDDGVRQGEVEHQVVDVGPAPTLRSGQTDRISMIKFCARKRVLATTFQTVWQQWPGRFHSVPFQLVMSELEFFSEIWIV